MTNPWVVGLATIAIIALSAYFVAIEFALLAAKRHRLKDAAVTSRSARAALRSSTELTLVLAGSQLGITACTLALGAVTKPAVHHWLIPAFEASGLGIVAADILAFVVALFIVTFLHLVIGEMAPKSWAIAHPEKSATLLALPMRAFMSLTRPALTLLNSMANGVLRRVGIEPVDELAAGQNPDDLRHLVEHSFSTGALDASFSTQLNRALDLQSLTVRDLVQPGSALTAVGTDATAGDVRAAARSSGHMRILVTAGDDIAGVVHVRDTLPHPADSPAVDLMRPTFSLEPDTPVHAALTRMRETRNHLAVVRDNEAVMGLVTMADALSRLFPDASGSTAIAR